VRRCPSCARELERLRALSETLGAAFVTEMPAGALDRLHGRVGSVREVFVLRTAARVMAAAATLLVACAVWFWQADRIPEQDGRPPESWEIAAVSLQAGAPAEAGVEALLTQWIVSDLSRENGRD